MSSNSKNELIEFIKRQIVIEKEIEFKLEK